MPGSYCPAFDRYGFNSSRKMGIISVPMLINAITTPVIRRRIFIAVFGLAAYAGVAISILYPAMLLALFAVTGRGRLVGLGTMALIAVPAVLLLFLFPLRNRFRFPLRCSVACLAGAGICLYLICYILTPNGRNVPGASLTGHYTAPARYRRYSLANLVPEIDQLMLGAVILPRIDPYFDHEQAQQVRKKFLKIYRALRASDQFNQVGSVLGFTYRDLLFNDRSGAHFYAYIPTAPANTQLPVLLFIHGSLGNFKGYMWVWKAFADEHGFAILAPTFGTGDWNKDGGLASINAVRDYCESNPRLKTNELYLAGLSNGGLGALAAARARPEAYRGLILLSAVQDTALFTDPDFLRSWRRKPVLVLHGEQDRRIPLEIVNACAIEMHKRGMNVSVRYYEGEDHFLLFSQPLTVMDDIAGWIQAQQRQTSL